MEQSFRAYADAARIAPDDIRIANDAGSILTRYLQRDPVEAERYLLQAARLGEAQVPELERKIAQAGQDPAERKRRANALENVESALGDAYQNLGVLYLSLRGDPKTARAWFEKSLATGPDPREELVGQHGYLQRCDDAQAGRISPRIDERNTQDRWAHPIAPEQAR